MHLEEGRRVKSKAAQDHVFAVFGGTGGPGVRLV
jgi:hypothetical protein